MQQQLTADVNLQAPNGSKADAASVLDSLTLVWRSNRMLRAHSVGMSVAAPGVRVPHLGNGFEPFGVATYGKGSDMDASRRGALADRLFTEHPRSLGMSWAQHAGGALKIGFELLGAAGACFVHALVPGWFTETAGRTIVRLHSHIASRKAGAANPDDWPDYEI